MKSVKKDKGTRRILSLFVLIISLSVITSNVIGSEVDQLAGKRYSDPKGYFKIVPPAGWRTHEYPQDPRGKVAFLGPKSNIELRVLVNAVDFGTTDALVRFCKDIEKRIGINTNIKRITFGGRPAVERTFRFIRFKGLKFYAIDFLVGKVDHNLQYGAPEHLFDKYRPIVLKSMETYEPVLRKLTDDQAIKHAVAKKYRLAQLMMELGNLQLALDYVKEGLEIASKDIKFLKLKQQIEDKLRKR